MKILVLASGPDVDAIVATLPSKGTPVGTEVDPHLMRLLSGLTPREREVARLVAQGLSNNEIAAAW